MESECPSCRFPISGEYLAQSHSAVGNDQLAGEKTEVNCPNCGAGLTEVVQPTISFDTERINEHSREFAHFKLQKILGRGGFGTVWLAEDLRLERQVALKLPTRRVGGMSDLMREAKTAAKLNHPNIVSIHDVGVVDDQVFIVCEYIDGVDLCILLQRGLLPEHRVIELLRAIALGLHEAHEHQIVHRDMKPANVMVDESGTPLVTDFGLAKNVDVEESISSKGRIVGTIMYMSPEQAGAESDKVDRRADIYAVGVMMYEMLTGERPFRGDLQAILLQKSSEDPAPLRSLRPSVPRDLETICLKCLQRSPARRYETAMDFYDELDRYVTGMPILARPVSAAEHAWRWCERNRVVASLLTMLILSLSIGLAGTSLYWARARDQTEQTRRSLYASQMLLANNYLTNGDIEATRKALDRFRTPELQHFRGFEWHYLEANLQRFKQSVQHGNAVDDVAMSRDGDWFASIANDRVLRVWESKSGSSLREIPSKIGRWQAVAISARENQLAAGAKDGTVYLWKSIQDTQLQPRVIKHGPGVTIVKFSADGKRLFSGGIRGAIRVWDASTLDPIQEIPTGQEGLVSFDVSKDGSVLVMVGSEGTMRAWDVDTRSVICLVEDDRRVEAVAVSANGDRFTAGTYGGTLMAYETKQGSQLFEEDTRYDWISDLQFLASGSVVAVCSSKGAVAFFDIDARQELGWIETHDGAGGMFATSSNAKSMVVGSVTGEVKLVDIADYPQITVIRNDQAVRDVCIVADRVVVAAYDDGSVKRLDFPQRSTQVLKEPTERADAAIAASSQASLIAIAQQTGAIELLDSGGELISTIPPSHSMPLVLRLSAEGDLLLVAHRDGTIFGFSIQRDREPIASEFFLITNDLDAAIQDLCISADGRRIAVALDNNAVRFIDVAKQDWSAEMLSLEALPVSTAFAGEDLIVGTRDGFLSRFDGQSLSRIWATKAHLGHLNMVTVIPHGEAVATVGRDKDLHIWDLVNGDLRVRLFRHERQIFAIDASPDGRTLVTGGLEGDVRIWRSREPD